VELVRGNAGMKWYDTIINECSEFFTSQGINVKDEDQVQLYFKNYEKLKITLHSYICNLGEIMSLDFNERKLLLLENRPKQRKQLKQLINIFSDMSNTDTAQFKYLGLDTPLRRAKALREEITRKIAPNELRDLELFFIAERMKVMKNPERLEKYSNADILNFFTLLFYENNYDDCILPIESGDLLITELRDRIRVALYDFGWRYKETQRRQDSNINERLFIPE